MPAGSAVREMPADCLHPDPDRGMMQCRQAPPPQTAAEQAAQNDGRAGEKSSRMHCQLLLAVPTNGAGPPNPGLDFLDALAYA